MTNTFDQNAKPGQYIRVTHGGRYRETVNYITNGLCAFEDGAVVLGVTSNGLSVNIHLSDADCEALSELIAARPAVSNLHPVMAEALAPFVGDAA